MPTEDEAISAAAEGATETGTAVATGAVEPSFFVALADSMTPTAYLLAYLMVALFFFHGIVLGVFLLNTFVDASLTTASERARNLWRTLGFIFFLQVLIGLIFAVIVLMNRSAVSV